MDELSVPKFGDPDYYYSQKNSAYIVIGGYIRALFLNSFGNMFTLSHMMFIKFNKRLCSVLVNS